MIDIACNTYQTAWNGPVCDSWHLDWDRWRLAGGGPCHVVKFERLVTEPMEEVKELARFVWRSAMASFRGTSDSDVDHRRRPRPLDTNAIQWVVQHTSFAEMRENPFANCR